MVETKNYNIKEIINSHKSFFQNNVAESSLFFKKFFLTSEKQKREYFEINFINNNNEIETLKDFKSKSLIESIQKIISLNK